MRIVIDALGIADMLESLRRMPLGEFAAMLCAFVFMLGAFLVLALH